MTHPTVSKYGNYRKYPQFGKLGKSAYLLALTVLIGAIQACGGGGGDTAAPQSAAGASTFHLKGADQVYTTAKPIAVDQLQIGLLSASALPVFVDGRNAGARNWLMAGLAANSSAFNLVTVGNDGISRQAIESPYLNRVAYTVRPSNFDPIGGKSLDDQNLYIAFTADAYPGDDTDFSEFITRNDPAKPCALYHVNTETDEAGCVLPNVEPVAYLDANRNWGLFDGGNRKPIQFDAAGNIYVAGYPFSVSSSGKVVKESNARLYKISPDFSTPTKLSQDNESVAFFTLFPSGEPVVALKRDAAMDLVLFRNSDKGAKRVTFAQNIVEPFVNTDSYRTLLYGSASGTKGINLVRTNDLGVDQASIDYNAGTGSNYSVRAEGKSYFNLVPRRIILSDDGNFYTVYSATATEWGQANNVLLVYQTLPFDAKAKAVIPVGGVANWWAEMKNRPIQIRGGILYYAKSEQRPNAGSADVIQVVRLNDVARQKLFADKNYRIDSWQAVGDKLFFSGIDNDSNQLVQGTVFTKSFATNADWSDAAWSGYAKTEVKPTASAKDASIQIQDMESLAPLQPVNDPGDTPAILRIEGTNKSATLSFNKYMNMKTVESVLGISPKKTGVAAPVFYPVWGYQNLHLVYDSSAGGLSLPATEGLPAEGGRFDLVASGDLPDAYNNLSILKDSISYTLSPPTIGTQPTPQTATVGSPASFSVAAEGFGTLTYQWKKNGTDIANATASTYTTPATVGKDNGAVFTVVVSNSVGASISSDATLTVTQYDLVANASGGTYDRTECVKDLSTGLVWEGKTTSGTRDGSLKYTHYDSTEAFQKPHGKPTQADLDAATNSIGYVKSVNASGLCGFTDWRLPTEEELLGIWLDVNAPKIDSTWFPNTLPTPYWVDQSLGADTAHALAINFNETPLRVYPLRYEPQAVRLVRGSP